MENIELLNKFTTKGKHFENDIMVVKYKEKLIEFNERLKAEIKAIPEREKEERRREKLNMVDKIAHAYRNRYTLEQIEEMFAIRLSEYVNVPDGYISIYDRETIEETIVEEVVEEVVEETTEEAITEETITEETIVEEAIVEEVVEEAIVEEAITEEVVEETTEEAITEEVVAETEIVKEILELQAQILANSKELLNLNSKFTNKNVIDTFIEYTENLNSYFKVRV